MAQTVEQQQDNKSKKVKALLAGGLVLGVGAAVTLAAWTDQEWATGLFGTGAFNIQSSVTGEEESFDDHESEGDPAELEFDLGVDNIAPNETFAAPFVLRLDEDTTYEAEVVLAQVNAEGANAANLTYGIEQVASAEACDVDATGTTIVPSGTALTSNEGASAFTLTPGADDAPGEATTLCFQVASGEILEEGEQTTAAWEFVGTSQD